MLRATQTLSISYDILRDSLGAGEVEREGAANGRERGKRSNILSSKKTNDIIPIIHYEFRYEKFRSLVRSVIITHAASHFFGWYFSRAHRIVGDECRAHTHARQVAGWQLPAQRRARPKILIALKTKEGKAIRLKKEAKMQPKKSSGGTTQPLRFLTLRSTNEKYVTTSKSSGNRWTLKKLVQQSKMKKIK